MFSFNFGHKLNGLNHLSHLAIMICIIIVSVVLLLNPLFIFPSSVLAATTIFSNPPGQVKIGEEFPVNFNIGGLNPSSDYYLKSRIGPDTSHLTKGQTKGTDGGWLSDSDSWASNLFPKFTTDISGNINGQITCRVSPSVGVEGTNIYILRILKVGDETSKAENLEGPFTFTVNPAPTSSPTPPPTPTITPTPKIPTATPTLKPTSSPKPPTITPTSIIVQETAREISPTSKITPTIEAADNKTIDSDDRGTYLAVGTVLSDSTNSSKGTNSAKSFENTEISENRKSAPSNNNPVGKILILLGGVAAAGGIYLLKFPRKAE